MSNHSSMGTRAGDGPLTVEAFAVLPDEEGYRLELSRGRLVREPAPGPRHGSLVVQLVSLLHRVAEEKGLGLAFSDTAFVLPSLPETVRVPDIAFVSSSRVPQDGLTDRFWELAPDLAVEVVSPSNRVSEMQRKALDYLDAGARLVWVVDPAERSVIVYRSRSEIRILGEGEVLDGGEVLPELRLPLEKLFSR